MRKRRAKETADLSAVAQKEGTMSSKAPTDPRTAVSAHQYASLNGNGQVKATVYLKKETLKKAKHIALEQETTLSNLTQLALEKYFDEDQP
jgi:hypothetical protein